MKQLYTYFFLIDNFTKTESQMIDIQKMLSEIKRSESMLNALDKCLVNPKNEVIERILAATVAK